MGRKQQLGLPNKFIKKQQRGLKLCKDMATFVATNKEIPIKWIIELKQLWGEKENNG